MEGERWKVRGARWEVRGGRCEVRSGVVRFDMVIMVGLDWFGASASIQHLLVQHMEEIRSGMY